MSQNELRQKIVAFFKTYEYSNLTTIAASGMPKGRMMENLTFGDDLVCWFGTGYQSNKVREIHSNPKVSVFLYRPDDHSSICLQGEATVVTDEVLRKEKWKEKWAVYWPDGPTNEDFTLIKIVPRKFIYLDWPSRKQEVLDL
ncbi:MAG: pyridoxamine 5'-phosphate oxidase family protein [Thermodesulfobacteriota bacterium]|jgi:general stress protein 26